MASNLQTSERVIATILHRLIQTGLQSSTLDFAGLNLSPEVEPFFATSVDWLLREGIVAARDFAQAKGDSGRLIDPVITAKGFAMLGQWFGPKAEGRRLHKAVAEVASGAHGLTEVGDFIGGILGGFTKSIGE